MHEGPPLHDGGNNPANPGSFWLLTRSSQADEDDPQFSDALGTDTPEEVGVKLAESLMREPITKSDRGRQGLLTGRQLRNAGVVLQRASDRYPAERQRPLPVQTGRELVAAVANEHVDLVQRLQSESE